MGEPENKFVQLWQAQARKSDPGGPDSVTIDEDTFTLPRISNMAEQVKDPVEKHLPATHFNNVVRWIKRVEPERLQQLLTMVERTAGRLGIRRRALKSGTPIVGTPAGSDQFDSGSVGDWLDKINPGDTQAITQLRTLHATLRARLAG